MALKKVKRLAVLGSTGSIGTQTLEVVRAFPGRFSIKALAAARNIDLLAKQVKEFRPDSVSCSGMDDKDLRDRLRPADCAFPSLEEIASRPDIDLVVIATSGTAGLGAALAAVRAGKTIALANKESLVAAGEIITREMKKSGAEILPVDSEHSAIWQCLRGEKAKPRRIILTASGGPFRAYSRARMAGITVKQALAHPSWKMGKKVTIDSATLMNKGLEVIEAHWLFGVPIDRVTVLVHPQSVIHSMVEFADGSVKAQLSVPDMRLPIQHALCYPDRPDNPALPRLDWTKISGLTFEPPDEAKFPCLRLAIGAGKEGGTCPAVLCAADEVAVDLFLAGRLKFTAIPRLVAQTLGRHTKINRPSLEEIIEAEKWGRDTVLDIAGGETE
jgi:1-deoxy-D-xylulose-5-phosphate reductoisomerase